MKNPFLFLFRARDKPQDAVSAATTFSFGMAGSGKSVNARTAIQVSTVYACVRVIAEQSVNRALFSEKEKGRFYCQFNLDGLMRGSYKERMEGYSIAINNGFMSPNDVRNLENLNPIPKEEGGDAYLVNGNMITIKRAMEGHTGNA